MKSTMESGLEIDAVNRAGSAIEILPVVPQLLSSVIETEYVPELKLVAVAESKHWTSFAEFITNKFLNFSFITSSYFQDKF